MRFFGFNKKSFADGIGFSSYYWMLGGAALAFSIIATGLVYYDAVGKLFFISFAALFLLSIFKFPELGVALCFSSAIFKEWISQRVTFFSTLDFTILIFLITLTCILFVRLQNFHFFHFHVHFSFIPLLLFSCLLILSLTYTPSFEYGRSKTISFIVFNWGLFLLPIALIQNANNVWRLIYVLLIIGAVVCIVSLGSLLKGIIQKDILFTYRASFLGVNPISFGGWVGTLNILLICLFPNIKRISLKVFAILLMLLFSINLVVANSRGPLISFICALLIILSVRIKRLQAKTIILFLGIGFLLIATIFIVLPQQLTNRYLELMGLSNTTDAASYFTVNNRLAFWNASWMAFTENINQFLIGKGVGGFSHLFYGLDVRFYPHNIFMEVLCELGIVGFLSIVWYFFVVFNGAYQVLKAPITKDMKYLLFAVFMATIFLFFCAQFSGDLNDNRRLWFFCGWVVAIIGLNNSRVSIRENTKSINALKV
jgi:O-antigen ligase